VYSSPRGDTTNHFTRSPAGGNRRRKGKDRRGKLRINQRAGTLGNRRHEPKERFVVDTDASNVEIGGVISQVQERQERVITYSETLNKAERNYYVTRRRTACNHEDTGTFS
jgi:hypothetical protein